MFLEPIYLNEAMLLNCASYLFGGVVLNEEKTTSKTNDRNTRGKISGSGGGKLGISLFSELIHANGELEAESERNHNRVYETKATSQITLGAIHQSVLEEMSDKNYIRTLSAKNIHNYSNDNKYIKLKATLVPVDYFAILQILKMVIPQLKNFFNLFGSMFLNTGSKSADEIDELENNIANAFLLVSDLVVELEKTYLESKQLEMIMLDGDEQKPIGVLDIDIADKNPNEIKAKLTDGSFIIIGKVTKFAKNNEAINLLQRSLLSTIIEKIEIILGFMDSRATQSDEISESSLQQWIGQKKSISPLLDKIFVNEIKGNAVRIKAMSVCM